MRRRCLAAGMFLGLAMGAAATDAPMAGGEAASLQRADRIKTSNHAEFVQILHRLEQERARLPPEQQSYLRYLEAWQVAYAGDYERASSQLGAVIGQSDDPVLRVRALATLVNILGVGHRYEEAFARMSQMLEQLPRIDDKAVRYQALGEAAQLLIAAGQYELAVGYADQMLADLPPGESACKAMFFKLHARYRSGEAREPDAVFQEGVDTCVKAGEILVANAMRADVAALDMRRGRVADAIALLEKNYADVRSDQYPSLTAQVDGLLAQAYWTQGNVEKSEHFAHAVIDNGIKGEYTEPLSQAYEVLYRIARQRGDFPAALAWHEKYMAADKGYLDDVGARTLAYQMVRQQVQARKEQVDALNKQNQILQLQQALDRKAVETSRLYIVLLLTVLGFIALWLYRLKRSQLRFMRLARRDGLTGIYNRQHFVAEAEQALAYARRSARGASLVLLDLDHFKQINDSHGHAVGDQVLKQAVAVCQQHLRSTDIFGRLGGEEFGILLPECPIDQVLARAERIRREIEALSGDGHDSVVTASLGVASTARSGYELRQLLVDADAALYRAKRAGRNRVVSGHADAEDCAAAG